MTALPSYTPPSPQKKRRSQKQKLNRASAAKQAHRRQAVEASTKLMTYGVLSIFGVATLSHLIGYNLSQRSKLHYLQGALKTAQDRADKLNNDFGRSFDRQLEKSVMQENSYKIAPDRLPIAVIESGKQTQNNTLDR
jgi:hypothetical protein